MCWKHIQILRAGVLIDGSFGRMNQSVCHPMQYENCRDNGGTGVCGRRLLSSTSTTVVAFNMSTTISSIYQKYIT
jgi:hypothetical protein